MTATVRVETRTFGREGKQDMALGKSSAQLAAALKDMVLNPDEESALSAPADAFSGDDLLDLMDSVS